MRWNSFLQIAAIAGMTIACSPDMPVEEPGGPEKVEVRFDFSATSSRSSLGVGEDAVRNFNVFFYSNSALVQSLFSGTPEGAVTLTCGVTYDIFAVANVGKVDPPTDMTDLPSLRIRGLTQEFISRNGLPMVHSGSPHVFSESGPVKLDLSLSRLVSRVELSVRRNLVNCELEFSSVRIGNAPSDIAPFEQESKASEVCDGDFACPEDLQALSRGSSIGFYVLENRRGVLLPDNDDPLQKNPLPLEEGGLCTYIQMEGTWRTPGATASIGYRIYPGTDNCSDFSIIRNKKSHIDLELTDEGTIRQGWNVTLSDLDDRRTLAFEDDTLTVLQGIVSIEKIISDIPDDGYGIEYDRSEFEDAGLYFSQEGKKLYIGTDYTGDKVKFAHMTLKSWDGRKISRLVVRVDYIPESFRDYSGGVPEYLGQFSCLDFPNASAGKPVTVTVDGKAFTFDGGGTGNPVCFRSSDNAFDFYCLPRARRFLIHSVAMTSGRTQIVLSCLKGRDTLALEGPVKASYSASPLILSQTGDLNADGDGFYDVKLPVSLLGKDGETLDLSEFKVSSFAEGLDEIYDIRDFDDDFLNTVNVRFGTEGCAGFEIENSPQPAIRFFGLDVKDNARTSFAYSIENSAGKCNSSASSVEVVPAFPDGGYLGSVSNNVIVRGCADTVSLPSVNPDRLYSGRSCLWTVRHSGFVETENCRTVFERGAGDSFSEGTSIEDWTAVFDVPSGTSYPSCGGMALKATTSNPHSGKTFTEYYTYDVVLEIPIGVSAQFVQGSKPMKGTVYYHFVPFSNLTFEEDFRNAWQSFAPSAVFCSRSDGSTGPVTIPSSVSQYECGEEISNYPGRLTMSSASGILSEMSDRFAFGFTLRSSIRMTDVDMSRDGCSHYSDFYGYAYGDKGYFHMYRQYDKGGYDDPLRVKNGMQNYILEVGLDKYPYY